VLHQIKRLAKHSAIYGLGGLVSRILAVILLPLYTRYLTRADYGSIETLIALTAVLVTLLRMGISSAFFRFYFDSKEEHDRVRVVRTSFWFTMTMATLGLVAGLIFARPISQWLFGTTHRETLVIAAFVGLWAQMNYEQLTSLFRVEERSVAFVCASLANVLITIGATLVFVVAAHWGATGVLVGNFTGTLCVYAVLLGYRRYQLGLEFDRKLFRAMNRFGMPLVPSALALWAINFADRFILVELKSASEVGVYSIGVRIASAMVLLLTAFRTAWPAFAYSIDDEREAKQTYGFVLTYLVFVASWVALALGLLAPWIVHLLTTPRFYGAARTVAPLALATVPFAGYIVLAIGVGRARITQFNWIVTGIGAAVNVALCLALIPPYGIMGAAYATVAGYGVMFVVMAWWAQRIYPVPYQWRRVTLALAAAVALTAAGKALHVSLPVAVVLTLAYPLALLPVGFYLPAERRRLLAYGRRLVPVR
jgi:O-antigen/teichoic acid export membrane protein